MASCNSSFKFQFLLLAFCLWIALFISPSYSLKCTSQKFKRNKSFSNCADLPVLNSYIHYTYNSSNSSLSIAFVAAPPKPEGWVSWAINPTELAMLGSQAFIAFKSKSSIIVNTYNISTYDPPKRSNLSFNVWDLSAETDGDNFVIFATVALPEKTEKLNQVWQVGGLVKDGEPQPHLMEAPNKNSKDVLLLTSPSGAPVHAPAPSSPNNSSSMRVSTIGNWNLGLVFLFILIVNFVSI